MSFRQAIMAGALTLFARDGYTRARRDAIAVEAGVSNRTIYNHFTDKAELFQAVMQESTQRVNAEVEHIPPAALKLWQETGPGRARRELAERLRRIAERGDLMIDDPARAAGHPMLLISADNPTDRADLHNEDALREMVTAGVLTFLYGYAERAAHGS
ncbi:helix-turn-helix domain-containing protein [Nonomuraea sp. NPDC052129]|uniref:TetR/AcrR family transcriptional regulator n=1 Tax=Nonomuraea sp. NPDC052129 TaxID=3154651 RepID=UPI0034417030